jgi:hypothetical protein
MTIDGHMVIYGAVVIYDEDGAPVLGNSCVDGAVEPTWLGSRTVNVDPSP